MNLICLLIDFGLRDDDVAAMKGVLISRAKNVNIVEISHQVSPGDLEEAAFLLEAAAPYSPASAIRLAVVDLGVGNDRAVALVELEDGRRLVAPDNGVLDGFFDRARRVIAVSREDLYLDSSGTTFHGRDRFASLVAALATGLEADACGGPLESPKRLERSEPKKGHGFIEGRVIYIDRFGNIVTDIPASWPSMSTWPSLKVTVGASVIKKVVDCYEEIPPGEDAVLLGSLGFWELSRNGESMAEAWNIRRGQSVKVRFDATKKDSKSAKHRAEPKRGNHATVGVQDHKYPERELSSRSGSRPEIERARGSWVGVGGPDVGQFQEWRNRQYRHGVQAPRRVAAERGHEAAPI